MGTLGVGREFPDCCLAIALCSMASIHQGAAIAEGIASSAPHPLSPMVALPRPPQSSHSDHFTVHYILNPDPTTGRVHLRLWELAPGAPDANQEDHYLYRVNYAFDTLPVAEEFLQEYLLLNGSMELDLEHLPPTGQIAILPYPTWS